MLGILAQSVLLFIHSGFFLGGVYFALAMLFLNLSFFMEDKVLLVSKVVLIMFSFAAVILLPYWYIGAIGLLPIAGVLFEQKNLCRAASLGMCVFAMIFYVLMKKPSLSVTILSGILLISVYLILEVLLLLMRRMKTTDQKLERALTSAAVEAMEQRSLREEIAKSQKLNERNARLEERERISRDIHNYVGHTLSAATVTLDAASMLVPNDQERAIEKIEVANSRVHEAITSVRSVVRTLDAEDDKIMLSDYMKSLDTMTKEFMMDTDVKVYHNFAQIDSEDRIPIDVASFLSSSLSELLTNGVKHGEAKIFVVTFVYDEKNVRLKVQDNGNGWGKISLEEKKSKMNQGYGLRKMRDYAETCGGSCVIESEDGFVVSLSLPLEG
ncbi:MAG: hypothetical protein IKG93_05905 [Clostridiales bacterium]|nr:hypothetical protein [Clostridiales bacterium]